MKKIMLAAAAVVAISGSAALAASDNYGSNGANQPAVGSVDNSQTGSIRNSGGFVGKLLNSSGDVEKSAPQSADRDLFGNR